MFIQKFSFVFFLLAAFNLFSQSVREFDEEAITKVLYQHTNDSSPGMAVGIVKDGNIVYEKYIGFANMEHEIKVDKNTRFNIASNAKQFTALCILTLVEQGKISLEDDLRKYLPDLYKNSQYKITLANLLTHTSGIRDVYGLWALKGQTWWKLFVDNEDAMELLQAQTDLNFKPGADYLYSNSNYILLTEIVKKVTNKDFSEFAEAIFIRLGMSDTNFLTGYMQVVPKRARPYGNWGGWKEYPTVTALHGDGGLYTNLSDQMKWEQIVQNEGGEYLSKEIIEKSQNKIDNTLKNADGYGLMFEKHKGVDYTYHDGNTGAYNATFWRFPAQKLSIVVMSNNSNVPTSYMTRQIAEILLEFPEDTVYPDSPDKIEPLNKFEDLLGFYENENETIIKITEKDGSISREIYGLDPVKLIQQEGAFFQYENRSDLKMNFSNIGQSDQYLTIYPKGHQPDSYRKLSAVVNKEYDKKAVNGSFYNLETDTRVVIKYLEGNTYSITKNGKERKAEMIYDDFLRMNSYEIKVRRNKNGNITGLKLNNDRIRNVVFHKDEEGVGFMQQ